MNTTLWCKFFCMWCGNRFLPNVLNILKVYSVRRTVCRTSLGLRVDDSTHGMILFINLVSTHHLRSCSINMTALIPSLLVLSYLRLADKRAAWVWSSWWKKIEETKPMTSLAATFWSPSIWLPPNITWADFEERSDFAQFHHLLVPFPLALILVLLRLIFEQGVFRPLGSWLGIASPPR